MDVAIVAQRNNDRATELAATLAEELRAVGATAVFDETTAGVLSSADEAARSVAQDEFSTCALVVSIGGDGTFLYAARGAGTTPVLGVNLGEVGFLNVVAPEEAVETVLDVVERIREKGEPRTTPMPRLAARGSDWSLDPAINEVVVHGPRRGHGGGATITVRVDGDDYTESLADGVIVATPTGSTAYNLSENGPIVHPSVDGIVVTQMAGADAMPPLVVDGSSTVAVEVTDADRGVVVSDGRVRQPVDPPARVTVHRTGDPVRIAGPPRDFFGALGKLR